MQYRIDKKDGSGSATMTVLPKAVRTSKRTLAINRVRDTKDGKVLDCVETGVGLLMPGSIEALRPDSIAGCTIEFHSPEECLAKRVSRAQLLKAIAEIANPEEKVRATKQAQSAICCDDPVTITPITGKA